MTIQKFKFLRFSWRIYVSVRAKFGSRKQFFVFLFFCGPGFTFQNTLTRDLDVTHTGATKTEQNSEKTGLHTSSVGCHPHRCRESRSSVCQCNAAGVLDSASPSDSTTNAWLTEEYERCQLRQN